MIDMPAGGVGDIPFASMGDLGLDRRKVVIWCELGQAARLLAVAERLDPLVAAQIAKEIELAREL